MKRFGVIAAQSIGEPGHAANYAGLSTSAALRNSTSRATSESAADGTAEYRDMPVIKDRNGRLLSLARSGVIAVIDNEGRERSADKLQYGTSLLVKDGAKVKLGDRLAEWDPFTMPMITDKPGVVKYQDVIEGKTMTEQTDDATGIAQRVIMEYRASGRGANKEDLRPRMTLLDENSGENRQVLVGQWRNIVSDRWSRG